MANVLDELIKEIPDPKLRSSVSRELIKLRKEKKFGLVFEEHIPEVALLYGQPIKPGVNVVNILSRHALIWTLSIKTHSTRLVQSV